MEFHKLMDFLSNPAVASTIGAIIGFIFDVWKTAPKRKILRTVDIINSYAPIVFDAVEEFARVAKKKGDVDGTKIDKAMEYEKRMRQLIELYNGVINDDIIKLMHTKAQAINIRKKQEQN